MPTTSIIATLPKLTDAQKACMFDLYSRYYSNVRREVFFHDLNEKDWVITLKDAAEIIGFSTLQLIRLPLTTIRFVCRRRFLCGLIPQRFPCCSGRSDRSAASQFVWADVTACR